MDNDETISFCHRTIKGSVQSEEEGRDFEEGEHCPAELPGRIGSFGQAQATGPEYFAVELSGRVASKL